MKADRPPSEPGKNEFIIPLEIVIQQPFCNGTGMVDSMQMAFINPGDRSHAYSCE